jgi:hypothetical protein
LFSTTRTKRRGRRIEWLNKSNRIVVNAYSLAYRPINRRAGRRPARLTTSPTAIEKGSFTNERDSKTYKIVKMGKKFGWLRI